MNRSFNLVGVHEHDGCKTSLFVPIDMAVEHPWAGVVSLETNSGTRTTDSDDLGISLVSQELEAPSCSSTDITADWVDRVDGRRAHRFDDVEVVLERIRDP